MMTQPLISIIIPVHDVAAYLDDCIRSVVSQTYRRLEIILIDDGSADGSGGVCDAWKERDDRIRVVHRTAEGVSAARNAGLQLCTGALVAFADADDRIDPEMLEKMLLRMEQDHSDVVVCAYRWVDKNGTILQTSAVADDTVNTRQALSELIQQRNIKQTIWNRLYRRELVDGVLFEHGKIYEDIFWSYRVIASAKLISLMSDVLYTHLIRENSITHTAYSPRNLDALDGYRQSYELIRTRCTELYDDVLMAYMGYCLNHMRQALQTHQDKSVIDNIKARLPYRKTGHPIKHLAFRHKLLHTAFWHFPVTTARLLNAAKR